MNKNNCRVCGLFIEDAPWGENDLNQTFEICPCCGVEFGNEDYKIETIRDFRSIWISKGARWFDGSEKPYNSK